MISKELLSAVLGLTNPIEEISPNYVKLDFYISYTNQAGEWKNVHEVTHECKEWAYNLGYEVIEGAETIRVYRNKTEVFYLTNTSQHDNFKPFDKHYLFKACEWILNDTSTT